MRSLVVDRAKLRAAREKAGLTQGQLAARLHVDRCTVTKWETGKKSPVASNFKALCRVLRVTQDDLLAVDDDKAA